LKNSAEIGDLRSNRDGISKTTYKNRISHEHSNRISCGVLDG